MAKGRGVRKRQREKRMAQKRARKEAQQALYEARKAAGKNKKSKRYIKAAKGQNYQYNIRIQMEVPCFVRGKLKLVIKTVHGGDECGNIGCKRCSDVWQRRADKLNKD